MLAESAAAVLWCCRELKRACKSQLQYRGTYKLSASVACTPEAWTKLAGEQYRGKSSRFVYDDDFTRIFDGSISTGLRYGACLVPSFPLSLRFGGGAVKLTGSYTLQK